MRLSICLSFFVALSLTACATSTPEPTPASVVIATTVPATSGPTVAPTRPAATSTPAASPTTPPTAVPTEPASYGPDNFPADVNPLTGLKVADPALLNRRPLAVKVSQFPRRVRPQAGLAQADWVFEHYAEAGITRMTAIFLGNDVPKIGSIRSARLIDIVLTQSYQAMLVTSGSSAGTLQALAKNDFYNRVLAEATGYAKCPPLCREGENATTDNLFASTKQLWEITDNLKLNGRQDLHGLAFAQAAPAGGKTAQTARLVYHSDINVVEWRYDEKTGRYARWVDTATPGELDPHTDVNTNEQISAANVIVLHAHHQATHIVEDYVGGGHCGYEIQLWGSGPATVFRDGQAYEVNWVRFTANNVIGFVDAQNQPFPLKPGNTWVELTNGTVPTTFTNGVYTSQFKGMSQLHIGCPVNTAATPQP